MERAILFFRNRSYLALIALQKFYATHKSYLLPTYLANSIIFGLAYYNKMGLSITLNLLGNNSLLNQEYRPQMEIYKNSKQYQTMLLETTEKQQQADKLVKDIEEQVGYEIQRALKAGVFNREEE